MYGADEAFWENKIKFSKNLVFFKTVFCLDFYFNFDLVENSGCNI